MGALLVGALLALSVGLLATGVGLDRDRAFYPIVTMVVASYYALFAVMGASTHALVLESLVGAVFLAFAVAGFRWSLWIAAGALAAHGIFDLTHAAVISNPGSQAGGRSSVARTTLLQRRTWHGCSRADAFVPLPDPGRTAYRACSGLS